LEAAVEVIDTRLPTGVKLVDSARDINLKIKNTIYAAGMAVKRLRAGMPSVYADWRWAVPSVVYELLGTPTLATNPLENWAMGLEAASETKEGKIFLQDEDSAKYKGVYTLPYRLVVAPVMKVSGILVGTDKIGHFVQDGYYYFCEAHRSMMPRTFMPNVMFETDGTAHKMDDSSEMGKNGMALTGVYSNADIEANKQGMKFYVDLWKDPGMVFDISKYISDKWNEGSNPNYYTKDVAAVVWTNLLPGRWNGIQGPDVVFQIANDGNVSGKYARGSTQGTLNGMVIILENKSIPGAVTGIEVKFTWTEPGASGKGKWASAGEDKLRGEWGTDASGKNRGEWSLSRA